MKKILLSTIALGAMTAVPALAQDYPSEPIDAIVSWPAGGGTDIAARTVLKYAEPVLDTTFNVRNVAGGGGAIGYVQGAQMKPDGYSAMIMQFDILSIAAQGIAPVSYDDFDLVSVFATQPVFLFVPKESPVETLDDFIAAAGDSTLKIAGASIGGVNHQASYLMQQDLGVDYTYVPYKGITGILPALLAGEADAGVAFATGMEGSISSGDIRLIAVMADERAATYPDVPTFAELGHAVTYAGFYGMGVPTGTNPAQIETIEAAMMSACENGDFQAEAQQLGLVPTCLDHDGFAAMLDDLYPKVDEISAELLGTQ